MSHDHFQPANVWTRRRWLSAAASSSALCLLPLNGSTQADDQKTAVKPAADKSTAQPGDPNGWIDAHVHVWTPDVKAYPLAEGYTVDAMKPASFSPEQLLAHALPVGVSRIVLIQMSFYGFDNRYMLDVMQARPKVFSGVAVIDPDQKPAEEMKRLKALGVRGFRIRPGKDPQRWLDPQSMQTMWKTGADEGLAMCCLLNPEALPAVDRMCTAFPKTPVVIDHMARLGVDGQLRPEQIELLTRLSRHPQVYVKISAFYALGKKTPPYTDLAPLISRLHASFGPDRLMWATDCPYQVNPGHTYADSLSLLTHHLVSSETLPRSSLPSLLRGTASKVFYQ